MSTNEPLTSMIRRDKAIKYYRLAQSIADIFSKDPSTKVGCVCIYPDTLQVVSIGYNGMPRGVDESDPARWERPIKYKYVEHAERNAIYNCALNGCSLKGSICVVSMFPCVDCCRGLIQCGVKCVVSLTPNYSKELMDRWKPDWDISRQMFQEKGVELVFLEQSEINQDVSILTQSQTS
jgi:dCMP deaminase